ncbi:MAG: PH domain-containing protein [Methanobrevibacter sp.]|nr:PH domain-containing protein [Methanobrevibacter sp.]
MFDKNENEMTNETVLYKGRPNLFFSCKDIFLLFMLLGAISYLTPLILSFIAEIQFHLVNIINLPLATYTSFIIILICFLIIVWMLWIFLKWRVTEYTVTNFRIILKEGIFNRKSHYMPFNHIQDITVSQGIFRRIISIGHVIVVNAYDLTDIEFTDIHNPEDVQELIFNEMNKYNHDINEKYNPHFQNNNFRDSNNRNNLNPDYNFQNQMNNYPLDDSNSEQYRGQNFNNSNNNPNPNHYDYEHYDEDSYNKSPNLNKHDSLDHNIEEAMANLKGENRFINHKQESNDNYYSSDNNDSYKNHKRFHSPKRSKYQEHNKLDRNKEDKDLSIVDIYSRKFKRHK